MKAYLSFESKRKITACLPKKPVLSIFGMDDVLKSVKIEVGGSAGLAKLLGDITPQAVGQWRRVPVARVLQVERVTGTSRHELRPDIYPCQG